MFEALVRLLALTCLAAPQLAVATAPPVESSPATIEEVVVTGEQPGPGLWKVTRPDDPDGHVLWVLGNHSPLPDGFEWKSREVESVIAASQEVLAPPSINASVGPLGGITLLPSLIGVRRNPDGARLAEIVPADLYARWLPLKRRYLGDDDDVEQWRPIFAASELYEAALDDRRLVPYEGVWPQVRKIARRQRVPVREPEIELKVRKARAAIRQFKTMPLDDIDCFARTLQRLEADLDLMRDRANAWAVGDVARLRRLAPVERASACIGVVLESSFMRERGYSDVIDRARTAWLEAAEAALARNQSTLAVISIDEILKPDGHFARLRQKGYRVIEP
jgi:hypothetical protein